MTQRILIVCTGNLCRSPMAAALLRARLARDADHDWIVESAGTWAQTGRPASAYAIAEMADRGLDISGHQAQRVTRERLADAELVLVMTKNHAEALKSAFPDQADKVYMLSQLVGESYDILDPYGGSRMEYAYTAQELEELLDEGYERLIELVEGEVE